MVPNTTSFYVTGLNDGFIHSVEAMNDGGRLSLLESGFWSVVAFSGYVSLSLYSPTSVMQT
jgi:hypothetical protein